MRKSSRLALISAWVSPVIGHIRIDLRASSYFDLSLARRSSEEGGHRPSHTESWAGADGVASLLPGVMDGGRAVLSVNPLNRVL